MKGLPFGANLRNFEEKGHSVDAKKPAIKAKKNPVSARFPTKNAM
jgi:hypothetical protein